MRESRWLREIRTLDPERDCRRIVFLDSFHEFPFDTTRALELAFFKTFASPTIAALLDSTGEFRLRGQKRYDDTDLLMSAFSEDGWDGEHGRRALRRMNQIHGRFEIANDDFLYVLSAMVLEPLRWNERFGWRPLIEAERQATFHFWREIGRHMAIKEIPASLAELERFNVDYERERLRGDRGGRAARAVAAECLPRLVPAAAAPARRAGDLGAARRARRRGARPRAADAPRAPRRRRRGAAARPRAASASGPPPPAPAHDDAAA